MEKLHRTISVVAGAAISAEVAVDGIRSTAECFEMQAAPCSHRLVGKQMISTTASVPKCNIN